MGKGDKKSKRGKIVKGSFGKNRPRKDKNVKAAIQHVVEKKTGKK